MCRKLIFILCLMFVAISTTIEISADAETGSPPKPGADPSITNSTEILILDTNNQSYSFNKDIVCFDLD